MNKFLPQTGGHSLHLDEYMLMQDAYFDGFKSLIYKLAPSGNCLLDGFVVDTTGANVIYTSGFVAIAGEIFTVDAGVFTKSANIADILYVKPSILPQAPSPILYEDTSLKNVHISRKAILKYKESTDTDGIELSNLLSPGTVPQGGIIAWLPPAGKTVNDFFDTTGLGINELRGYALCNGLNQTVDLRGMYLPMATNVPATGAGSLSSILDGNLNNVVDQVGRGKQTLTQANIPNYQLPVTDPGHRHELIDGGYLNKSGNDGNNVLGIQPGNQHRYTSTNVTNISVNSGGSGTAFDKRPSSTYLYYITKIR